MTPREEAKLRRRVSDMAKSRATDAELMALLRAERDELVRALRKHGQHFGCAIGQRVERYSTPTRSVAESPRGVTAMGLDVAPDAFEHGCTCGLRLLLARYRSTTINGVT
jgi:hypothetical protein